MYYYNIVGDNDNVDTSYEESGQISERSSDMQNTSFESTNINSSSTDLLNTSNVINEINKPNINDSSTDLNTSNVTNEIHKPSINDSLENVMDRTSNLSISYNALSGNSIKSIIFEVLPTKHICIRSGMKCRLSQMNEEQILKCIKEYGELYSYEFNINQMTKAIESVNITCPTVSIATEVYNGLDDKGFAVKYLDLPDPI